MTRIDSIESLEDRDILTLECGHRVITTSPNTVVGHLWRCLICETSERRKRMQLPKPEDVLDAIVEDYVTTMQAQGVVIGTPERVAIRRAANIQYAWFCALRRVVGSQSDGEGNAPDSTG